MMSEREYTGRILGLCLCAFVAGVASYVDRTAIGVLATLLCIWVLLCKRSVKGRRWTSVAFSFVFLFALGYVRIWMLEINAIDKMHRLDGQEISAIAIVQRVTDDGYLIKIVDADLEIIGKPYLICQEEFLPGDVVSVTGVCELYNGATNPGEFSYMDYMKSCGNFFYVDGVAELSQTALPWNLKLWARLCQMSGTITSWTKGIIEELYDENAPVVKGMILGDTDSMNTAELSMYRMAGIGHYFAVSGLHIGLLAGGIAWVFGLIGIGHKGKSVSVTVSVAVLLTLCGFTPSSIRAAFMLGMAALARLLYRRSDTVTAVALSAGIALAINPYLVYNSGFILSHGAIMTFAILNNKIVLPITRTLGERKQKVANIIAGPVLFWIATAPMSGKIFGSVATYGILSNLLCSGLLTVAFGLALGSLAVGGVWLGAGRVLAQVTAMVISLVKSICQWIVSLPLPEIIGIKATFLGYALVLLPVLGLSLRHVAGKEQRLESHRWIAAYLVVPAFICSFVTVAKVWNSPKMRATYLSVGQGDSAVMEFRNGAVMVVDGSTQYYGARLLDYLQRRNIRHVDAVVLSHGHSDHGGGLLELMDLALDGKISIGKVYLSKVDGTDIARDLGQKANDLGVDVVWLGAGDSFNVAGNKVDVLWPVERHEVLIDENNYSLVLRLQVGQDSFIFTGDIESQVESFIIDYVGPCDVLKVAHHGSSTSTQDDFLKTVVPEIALISVGSNTYGHPSSDTLDRLNQAGSYIHVTKESGALVVETNGNGCRIVNWKGLWELRN